MECIVSSRLCESKTLVASNLSIIFQLGEMLLNHAKNTALVSVTETAVNVGRER
jgi:hypothetical protein